MHQELESQCGNYNSHLTQCFLTKQCVWWEGVKEGQFFFFFSYSHSPKSNRVLEFRGLWDRPSFPGLYTQYSLALQSGFSPNWSTQYSQIHRDTSLLTHSIPPLTSNLPSSAYLNFNGPLRFIISKPLPHKVFLESFIKELSLSSIFRNQ